MVLRRFSVLFLGFALILSPASGMAQEAKKGERDTPKEGPKDGPVQRILHLMPPAFAAEMKLTDDQRGQIQKLEQEFNAKRLKSLMFTVSRVVAIVDGLDEEDADKELAPILALAHEVTGALLESRRSRVLYEKKMVAVLNPEQQVLFVELKERRPRPSARQGGTTTFHFYLPEEKLKLTDEQKQKVGAIQKEMETRLRELLTDDQRRLFDESQRKGATTPKRPRTKEEQEK